MIANLQGERYFQYMFTPEWKIWLDECLHVYILLLQHADLGDDHDNHDDDHDVHDDHDDVHDVHGDHHDDLGHYGIIEVWCKLEYRAAMSLCCQLHRNTT